MATSRLFAALFLAAALSTPATVLAAKGDCSQPQSTGPNPAASDCLYILKVAVGSLTCSPACICAPKGTLPTTSSDALLCLRKSVGQPATLKCPCTNAATGDDFNDNSRDTAKWDSDDVTGNGVLNETNHVLQYTVGTASALEYVSRPWIGSFMPYDEDWEVQIDIYNSTNPTNNDQVDSFGVSVFEEGDLSNEVFGELYASHLGGGSTRHGFYGAMYDNDEFVNEVDSNDIPGLNKGAVRITFDATTKVLTLYYDTDPTNGYVWTEYGAFGVAGSGGDEGSNGNWGMTAADRFSLAVYGYSEHMTVSAGTLYGDNFLVTGGVAP